MAWNPLTKIKEAFGTKPAEAVAATAGMPELKELEKQGMLGKFFRHWKNPAFMAQLKAVTARMQADGVDLKDKKAVEAWVEKNKASLQSGQMPSTGPKPETVRKTGPDTGRNEPCHCGSGKKFKKCCANKTA